LVGIYFFHDFPQDLTHPLMYLPEVTHIGLYMYTFQCQRKLVSCHATITIQIRNSNSTFEHLRIQLNMLQYLSCLRIIKNC